MTAIATHRGLMMTVGTLIVLFTALGVVGHYVIGTAGVHVPYLS